LYWKNNYRHHWFDYLLIVLHLHRLQLYNFVLQ
jgi:hypothetical protein